MKENKYEIKDKEEIKNKTNRKDIDDFCKKALPILKDYGYLKTEIETNWIGIIIALIIGMTLSGVLFYGIYNDKFKSNVFQDVQLNPNITSLTNNQYDFNPTVPIQNDYEHKIYLNTTIYNNNFIGECP